MDKHQEIYLMCKVLLWIFPNILGNCQKNNKVQQIAAVASDIASAAYTPATPINVAILMPMESIGLLCATRL